MNRYCFTNVFDLALNVIFFILNKLNISLTLIGGLVVVPDKINYYAAIVFKS